MAPGSDRSASVMLDLPPSIRSRPVVGRVIAALVAATMCCPAEEKPTLFTTLETTPQAIGQALAGVASISGYDSFQSHRLEPFALAGFPCTDAEKEAVLAALTTKQEGLNHTRQREFAAMLLEAWGRTDAALMVL